MAERAHPKDPYFQDKWKGLKFIKSKGKERLYQRYNLCNTIIKDKIVADIPCGTGWGTSLLKRYKKVFAFDISEEAVAYAKKHFAKKNIEYAIGNMVKIPLEDNSIDVLCCIEGFEHISRESGLLFLEEAKRVLRNNGKLVLTSPILDENGKDSGNPYHIHEYDSSDLIDLMNKNFIIDFLELNKDIKPYIYRMILTNKK